MNIEFKIYKDNSKEKWVYEIPVPGKKNGIRKYGKTKAEAKKKAISYINDPKNANIFISNDRDLYIEDLLNSYLAQKTDIEDSSLERDERTAKYQIIPYIGHYKIIQIHKELLEKEFMAPLKAKYKDSTVKKAVILLKEMGDYAIENNIITSNPFKCLKAPRISKENKKPPRDLSPEEIKLFKNQSQKKYKNGKPVYIYGNQLLLCMQLGLRSGEMCALQWQDFNVKEKFVTICKTAITDKSRRTYIKNKTKTGVNRNVPLSSTALELLETLKNEQNPKPTDYILTGTADFIAPYVFSQSFTTLAKASGIKNPQGVHTLRHTFANQLFAQNVDVKLVSTLMGHASVKTTYDMYIKPKESDLADAVNALNNLF